MRVTSSVRTVMTANEVVSYRLRQAPELRRWTQEEAAEQLAPYLGARWSAASFSAAEAGARMSRRGREFTADELLALARCFDVPILFFLVPPPQVRVAAPDGGPHGIDPSTVFDALLGTEETWPALEEAAQGWARADGPGQFDHIDCPPWVCQRLSALVERLFAASLRDRRTGEGGLVADLAG